jgi:hypothetical protein
MTAAIAEVEAIVPVVQKAVSDCQNLTGPLGGPSPTCMADLMKLLPEAQKVVADVEAGNMAQAETDFEAMIPDMEKAA